MNWQMLIGLVLNLFASIAVGSNFKIYWNVPSSLCSTKFGINVTDALVNNSILINNKESFLGDKIVIFYQNKLGKYPYISKGKYINGGLPQLGNLREHLRLAEDDINKIIPDPGFNGLGIIDWEKWRPTWGFLWGDMKIYKQRTLSLVKKEHPKWDWDHILNVSMEEWRETTKQWMLLTMELATKLRPEGQWCYYRFPDCYNYAGKSEPEQFFCSDKVQEENDRLDWLWNSSTALCPSIYYDNRQSTYNETQNVWFLYGRLSEVIRLSKPKMPIYPYVNYKLHNSQENVPKERFLLMLSYAASLGLDGVVIWGSSKYFMTKEGCENLRDYVTEVIGPAATNISSAVHWCSKTFCNDDGWCTWPEQPYTSWKCLLNPASCSFDPEEITCRCQTKEGRYCGIPDSNSTGLL